MERKKILLGYKKETVWRISKNQRKQKKEMSHLTLTLRVKPLANLFGIAMKLLLRDKRLVLGVHIFIAVREQW